MPPKSPKFGDFEGSEVPRIGGFRGRLGALSQFHSPDSEYFNLIFTPYVLSYDFLPNPHDYTDRR
jgi:hypothetical protein